MGYVQWIVLSYLSLPTSILVPFGILLHYWRRADSLIPFPVASEWDEPAHWPLAVRRQIGRGRMASGIASVVVILSVEGVWFPYRGSDNWDSFLVPMAIAVVCIAVLLAPAASPRAVGEPARQIDLSSRSVWSFGQGWWFASWIVVAVVLVTTVVLAGLASSLDDQGRFAVLSVTFDTAAASSTFLGWYFGVPILIGVAVLAAVTLAALWIGARPPLAADGRKSDIWLRRFRTRTILALGGGALILTLGWSLLCIGAGAGMTLEVPTGSLGSIHVGTPLAGISKPLSIVGLVLQGVGVALVLLPLFTKRPLTVARKSLEAPTEGIRVSEPRA